MTDLTITIGFSLIILSGAVGFACFLYVLLRRRDEPPKKTMWEQEDGE